MNENIPSHQKRPNFSSLNGIHKQSTTINNVKGGAGKKLTIKNFKGNINPVMCSITRYYNTFAPQINLNCQLITKKRHGAS